MTACCPLCGESSGVSGLFVLPSYTVYQCGSCLARYVSPFVDNKLVYGGDFVESKAQYLNTAAMTKAAHSALLPYMAVRGKRVLDIGCGTGRFLDTLKADNEVLGLEISEAYKPHLEKKRIPHRIGILPDTLEALPDGYFDLVTLWDVFEHLEAPAKILALMKNKLSPEGYLIIWTNNYDDSISAFSGFVYKMSGGRFSRLIEESFNRGSGHNYNFVARSLEKLYGGAGLNIMKCVVTDTPSERLAKNIFFKAALEFFYAVNKLLGKGKIICHVLNKKGG